MLSQCRCCTLASILGHSASAESQYSIEPARSAILRMATLPVSKNHFLLNSAKHQIADRRNIIIIVVGNLTRYKSRPLTKCNICTEP